MRTANLCNLIRHFNSANSVVEYCSIYRQITNRTAQSPIYFDNTNFVSVLTCLFSRSLLADRVFSK